MTTSSTKPNVDVQSARRSLEERFEQFAKQVRARLLLEETAKFITLVLLLAFVTFILDRTLRLSLPTRRGLLLLFLVVCAIQAWRWLLSPLRLQLKLDVLAAALERSAGHAIAARAATILELPKMNRAVVSASMVETAVKRSHESLSNIDFTTHLNPRRRRTALQAIVATVIISLALIFISPSTARLWFSRLFAGSNQPWPQRTFLEVAGLGDDHSMLVPRGEPFILRVFAKQNSVPPDTVSIRWSEPGASPISVLLTKFAANDFRYDFPAIQSDATVELTGGDDSVGPVVIHPVDRPRIVTLQLLSQHPTESKPKTHNFSGDDAGDLSFLPYTKLELSFTANTPVADVHLTSSTPTPGASSIRRINDRQFAIAWEHSAATQLQIELTGTEARLTSAPTNVAIGLKTDKPPRTTLGFTGVRQRITPLATIPLVAEAKDDFGVDKMELRIKTEIAESQDSTKLKTTATTRPLYGPSTQPTAAKELEVRQSLLFKVAELQLQPGHTLNFTAAATDTCYPTPQTSTSRQLIFRVVSPEELFKEILVRQQAQRAAFRRQTQEAKNIRLELNLTLTPDSITQLAHRHRTMEREISRVQSALTDSLTEMKNNVLGNSDAYQLMESGVLDPMKSMDADLMTPQRDSLDTLKLTDVQSLSAAKTRQDQIVAKMEEILKQMAQWDSFIDVLNQLNEIIRLENQVQQGTTDLKKRQTQGIFDP
jgi:hypothetical protein